MTPITAIPDLFETLGRDPEELIGAAESEWLEFKKEPYYLERDEQRFELAKDVSAMANAGQGIIVIGVEAKDDPNLQ